MKTPILAGNGKIVKTRVFRPDELELIRKQIKKSDGTTDIETRTNFDMAFMLGARYEECRRIQNNPEWYDGEKFVQIEELKIERTAPRRSIRLSNRGINTIEYFFNNEKYLPSVQHWDNLMKEWSQLAGLGVEGVSARSLRKTWESWLVVYYPANIADIYGSQGHNEITSLKCYTNTAFTDEDIAKMKDWVDGYVKEKR